MNILQLAKKLTNAPKLVIRKIRNKSNSRAQQKIAREAAAMHAQKKNGIRVLLGPNFAVSHTHKTHHILLSSALAARGATQGYLSAPYHLPFCQGCANINQLHNPHPTYCNLCQRFQRNSANLIVHVAQFSEIFRADDFVTPDELTQMTAQVARMKDSELYTFTQDGLPLGEYSRTILRNIGYVGDEKRIPHYLEIFRNILVSQLIYAQYLTRAFNSFNPDIVVSVDAFYSPWHILYDLAQQHGVPFYNFYPGLRPSTFHYDKNKISLLLNVDDLFEKWKDKRIKESELKKLETVSSNRKKGKIYTSEVTWKEDDIEHRRFEELVHSGKPTAALYGNVLWDLTTLNREIVFDTVQETFLETVRFFVAHPQYNLIVKPHPIELHAVHESQEKLTDLIHAELPELPENILVLHPKTPITIYDLIPRANVSIVYTTTVGVESAILKTPTIILGDVHYRAKGFTYDPETREEFFAVLKQLFEHRDEKTLEIQRELARKYYYLYFFVYFHDYDIIAFDSTKRSIVKPRNLRALLAKKDFMIIIDAMLHKQPIPWFDEGIEETSP